MGRTRGVGNSSALERARALALLESGLTSLAVARAVGRSRRAVVNWAKMAGMTLVPYAGGVVAREDPGARGDVQGPRGNGSRLDDLARAQIEFLVGQGLTKAEIARRVGVHRSTIGRELARGEVRGRYVARHGSTQAELARRRPRLSKLERDPQLRAEVVARLNLRFSPRQVQQDLVKCFGKQQARNVSHETIYQALYVQGRGTLRDELRVDKALRSGRTRRIPASKLPPRSSRPWLAGHHLSLRPPEAADRAVPGHWEGDLVLGKGHQSALITLVERQSRFVMLHRLPDAHDSTTVVDALIEMAAQIPAALRKTLTWDQGSEMAQHARFTLATDVQVFFCDPHSPWQRGSNENTNGLIRDFYPKGTDFHDITDDDIAHTQHLLNIRPRATLDWATPAEYLNQQLVALTT